MNDYSCFLYQSDECMILMSECYQDDIYYRVDFKIEKNDIKIDFIKSDIKFSSVCYKAKTKIVELKDGILHINLDFDFEIDIGHQFNFKINKSFNLDNKLYKYRSECFDKLDDRFALRLINDLIESKQICNNSSFVFDNVEEFFEITRLIENTEKLEKTDAVNHQSEITIPKAIEFTQNFLNEMNINIDVNQLVKDEAIIFSNPNETLKDDEKKYAGDGLSYYDKEKNKKMIGVKNTNNFLMLQSLAHEIIHYYNQPENDERTLASEYLTEVVSYSYEMILIDKFLNSEYKKDAEIALCGMIYTLKEFAFWIYSPLLSVKLYKENGKVIKEDIEKYLKFENYRKEMQHLIMKKKVLSKEIWNIIGYFFAIYNYMEYKKDNDFSNKLLELNNSINSKSLMDCLKIINVNDKSDIYGKCIDSINECISLVNEKINNNKTKSIN